MKVTELFKKLLRAIMMNGLPYCILYALRLTKPFDSLFIKTHRSAKVGAGAESYGAVLPDGNPIDAGMYCRAYSVQRAGKRGREFLTLLCTATNQRILYHNYDPPEAAIALAYLEQHGKGFSPAWLIDMELLALGAGFHQLAGALRIAAYQNLLDKYAARKRVRPADAILLIWSYIFDNDFQNAQAVPMRLPAWQRKLYGESLFSAAWALRLDSAEAPSPATPTGAKDQAFAQYVKGRRIALLGPADGPLDAERVQKDFDLVIRVNYRGRQFLSANSAQCGCDVAYYRAPYADRLGDELDFMAELQYLVFPDRRPLNTYPAWPLEKMRHSLGYAHVFPRGTPTMIQAALLDLLHFDYGKVKLFNVNLYLSSSPYQTGYVTAPPLHWARRWFGDASHNIISQYEFTQALYDRGLIECDDECAWVLSLGIAEYTRRLEACQKESAIYAKALGSPYRERATPSS